ncbi:RraA family protein [Methylobacterium terricola]|uniref:Putative 4-hydroxy-4-methyl-2-oxoglutarate aldolase n=1 Tax=Methylobacterium terricola TaxID=2583531 RepID=A0A5C4LBK9_9HYPH|nr:RraA family protein [Methylobacterium terricola]TNC08943.1 RraA family protein [Methylobacterium terricola]
MSDPVSPGDADLLDALRGVSTASLSDNMDRLAGPVGLKPFHRGGMLVGRALTVRVRGGDNLAIHQALERVRPGDVVVVDGGGGEDRALVGGIMKAIAESRGAAGFVIDGAIRDAADFAASDFPCYARAVTHRGPYKTGPGEIGVPVSVGGWVIRTGDVVVGDADGVVTFPPDQAGDLLAAAKAQEAREAEVLSLIAQGRYDGRYAQVPDAKAPDAKAPDGATAR